MKKKMKRLGAMLLAGTMAASMLVGCGSASGGSAPAEKVVIMTEKGFDATTITQEDVDTYGI